jgi:hypothetical protein
MLRAWQRKRAAPCGFDCNRTANWMNTGGVDLFFSLAMGLSHAIDN